MTVPFRIWQDAILFDSWLSLAARGLLTLGLGLCALAAPGPTVTVLVVIFGAFAVADGVLLAGAASHSGRLGWASGLAGLASLGLGLLAFVAPIATASALVMLLGVWAVVTGTLQVGVATHLRHGGFALGTGGVLAVLFGLALLLAPEPSLVVLTRLFGVFACLVGAIYLGLAAHLRRLRRYGFLEPYPAEPDPAQPGSPDPADREHAGSTR